MLILLVNNLDAVALNIGKVFWLTMGDITVLNLGGADVTISVCMVGVKSLRITKCKSKLNFSTACTRNFMFRLHMTLVLCGFTRRCSPSVWKFIFSDPVVRKLFMLTVSLKEDGKCSASDSSSNWSYLFIVCGLTRRRKFLMLLFRYLGKVINLQAFLSDCDVDILFKWPVLWTSPNFTFSASTFQK